MDCTRCDSRLFLHHEPDGAEYRCLNGHIDYGEIELAKSRAAAQATGATGRRRSTPRFNYPKTA